jgi:hypothetical protein
MNKQMLILAALFLGACAANEEDEGPDAIDDFIEVSDLEEVTVIRSYDQLDRVELNDRYVILTTNKEQYLLAYYGRCTEIPGMTKTPDVRRDAHAIYAKSDTFHGCRIKAIYPISEAQEQELVEMGRAPGGR